MADARKEGSPVLLCSVGDWEILSFFLSLFLSLSFLRLYFKEEMDDPKERRIAALSSVAFIISHFLGLLLDIRNDFWS
jgi:hypothetical protein